MSTIHAMLTNNQQGPRGVWSNGVVIDVKPGETRALEFRDEAEFGDVSGSIFTIERVSAAAKPVADAGADTIKSAVELLDPANDEHWTAAGLPSVDAVTGLVGQKVTRAEIEAAAPAFDRETARASV